MQRLGGMAFVVALLTAVTLTAAARVEAQSFTGGGWIPGQTGGKSKATFGFDIHVDATSGETTGSFTYHDQTAKSASFPKGVNVHGTPVEARTGVLPPNFVEGLLVGGTYEAVRGVPGAFIAFGVDTGNTGAFKGDSVAIWLFPGLNSADVADLLDAWPGSLPAAAYQHSGVLGGGGGPGGGNLTVDVGASDVAVLVLAALVGAWAVPRVCRWNVRRAC
jgi:hypothetical protein